jgi:hypothetical protein
MSMQLDNTAMPWCRYMKQILPTVWLAEGGQRLDDAHFAAEEIDAKLRTSIVVPI